ncbi:hypothetical protein HanLR1_Chr04g0158281 [Helianthus annuus]|nr:hypothetical protein HanLR1_Chr04g0158281 [Helianthus annuus]
MDDSRWKLSVHLQDNHLTGVLDVLQDLPLIAFSASPTAMKSGWD